MAESKQEQPARRTAVVVEPDCFDPEQHFYPRVLNAQIHPLVANFMRIGNKRLIQRFCHLRPATDKAVLTEMLNYQPAHFRWAGSDLFNVSDADGRRHMLIVETNSCPSGQKSMPILNDEEESGGYNTLLRNTFLPLLRAAEEKKDLPEGVLAIVFDKNNMEASGYAAELATLTDEPIYLVEHYYYDEDPPTRWSEDGVLSIRLSDGQWQTVRACFRYVTQKPWNRIPLVTKTLVLNPVVACLAGGRNKMVAAKAYEFLNSELDGTNLAIQIPETICNVRKREVPLWVDAMGGMAVVKNPYSNAGQGVYTITTESELKDFMAQEEAYDKFIVQSLVGNYRWSSTTRKGQFYHLGTVPSKKGLSYVMDLRMMVCATPTGFRPIAIYSRRARSPLADTIASGSDSWDMLGTNLSVKEGKTWTTESNRLLLMDRRDFNRLGVGIDDLIDAYVQTCLSVIAIDKMARRLVDGDRFNLRLFSSVCDDEKLLEELFRTRAVSS